MAIEAGHSLPFSRHEDALGSSGLAPCIPIFSTECGGILNVTPCSFHPPPLPGKKLHWSLNRGLIGPWSRLGLFWSSEIPLPLSGFEPRAALAVT